jgi:hypothetical protein
MDAEGREANMRLGWCFVLVLSAAGCATAKIRAEAASTLSCPEREVGLEQPERGVWMATGCGRAAICTVPAVEGADVQCSGGGEALPPRR